MHTDAPLLSVTPVIAACCWIWLSWMTLVAALLLLTPRDEREKTTEMSPDHSLTLTLSVCFTVFVAPHPVSQPASAAHWSSCEMKMLFRVKAKTESVITWFPASRSSHFYSVEWSAVSHYNQSGWGDVPARARTCTRGLRFLRARVWSRLVHALLAPVRSAGWQAHAQHISPSVT